MSSYYICVLILYVSSYYICVLILYMCHYTTTFVSSYESSYYSDCARRAKRDHARPPPPLLAMLAQIHDLKRYSVCLLYWYKSTNTDADSRSPKKKSAPTPPPPGRRVKDLGTQFACFTGTKVQILTNGAYSRYARLALLGTAAAAARSVCAGL